MYTQNNLYYKVTITLPFGLKCVGKVKLTIAEVAVLRMKLKEESERGFIRNYECIEVDL